MKLIVFFLVAIVLSGCGRSHDYPKYANGETIQYEVPHMTEDRVVIGTGVVINASPSTEGWYYSVDVGTNSLGERECVSLHEKLLSRKK